jgi:myosin regulatory light chain 12
MPKEEKEKKEKKEKKSKKEEAAPAADEAAPAPAAEEKAEKAEEKEEKEERPKPTGEKKKIGNVFALFNQSQITEFKEAFAMIDQDRDGIIGVEDLAGIYQQVGREADPKVLKEMLAECPEKLNFTHFLNLFGEKLHGTDSETALRDAFIMFDEDKKGKLHEEYVKDLLANVGDQFSKDEIKQVWKEIPLEGGQIDYLKFVTIMKRGNDD